MREEESCALDAHTNSLSDDDCTHPLSDDDCTRPLSHSGFALPPPDLEYLCKKPPIMLDFDCIDIKPSQIELSGKPDSNLDRTDNSLWKNDDSPVDQQTGTLSPPSNSLTVSKQPINKPCGSIHSNRDVRNSEKMDWSSEDVETHSGEWEENSAHLQSAEQQLTAANTLQRPSGTGHVGGNHEVVEISDPFEVLTDEEMDRVCADVDLYIERSSESSSSDDLPAVNWTGPSEEHTTDRARWRPVHSASASKSVTLTTPPLTLTTPSSSVQTNIPLTVATCPLCNFPFPSG